MTNKYHRQNFLSGKLVQKLITSKAKKADQLLGFVTETKKMTLPKKLKDPKFKMKFTTKGKAKEYDKEVLEPENYIDIQNMSNNQLKKQIRKYGYIVGTKNKKLAERARRGGFTGKKIIDKGNKK